MSPTIRCMVHGLFVLGIEALTNLEVLDVSMNCISDYSSCFPLACLQKLVSVSGHDQLLS